MCIKIRLIWIKIGVIWIKIGSMCIKIILKLDPAVAFHEHGKPLPGS
jgi:hypothetical protein